MEAKTNNPNLVHKQTAKQMDFSDPTVKIKKNAQTWTVFVLLVRRKGKNLPNTCFDFNPCETG